jgi:hypothetical protein
MSSSERILEAGMDKLEAPFRRGQPDDAPLLAELINYAGEGMALHL